MDKKLFWIITLCWITFSAFAENVSPYTGSRIFWDTSTRTTIFNNGWYSRMIQLQDGRLMATCEGDGINITFSRNLGSSWDSATKIVTNFNNVPNCVPDLIQLSDGTIIVAYNPRPNSPYTGDRKFGIRCKRSTDNGKTWSNEIFVNDAQYTFDNGCWEPSMLELPSGELQLYFADEGPYTNSNEQQISMCRSFDGGQTWSAAQKVSFRATSRDGMPVPVLLKDKSSIVVAIEDNGWPGINDFYPTTIRCPLETNWNNVFVDANSNNRNKTLDLNYCPSATGGAPYLRVLPWGETVLSYQSHYNHRSMLNMFVVVGDEHAMNFKAMSNPFITSMSDAVEWNSLAVIDTGTIVAVGGVNKHIEMIKGYPVRLLQAPYGKPVVDGIQTKNEGYLKPSSTQIILGTQTGTRVTSDFAYNEDSLYFTARVSDRTQISNESQCDGVRLLIDADNVCSTNPQTGTYCFFFRLDSTYQTWYGDDGSWRVNSLNNINFKVKVASTYYVIEAAIPWIDLGKKVPLVNERMAATIEMQDRQTTTIQTERIPDAKLNAPWTWMEFRLKEKPETNEIRSNYDENTIFTVNDGKLLVTSKFDIKSLSFYSIDGKKLCEYHKKDNSYDISMFRHKILIFKVIFANGTSISQRISL